MGIKRKIMVAYVMFVLIPMLLLVLTIFWNISDILTQYLLEGTRVAFEQSVTSIARKIESMENTLNMVAINNTFNDILKNIVRNEEYTFDRQYVDYSNTVNLLRTIEFSNDIYRIKIYIPDNFLYAHEKVNLFPLSSFEDFDGSRKKTGEDSPFTYYVEEYREPRGVEQKVISVARPVRNPTDYTRDLVQIKAECKYDEIVKLFAAVSDGGMIYLSAPGGEKIIRDGEPDPGLWEQAESQLTSNWKSVENARGEKSYGILKPVGNTGLNVILIMPVSSVMKMRNNEFLRILAIMGIISILAYIMACYISIRSAKRLGRISENMLKVQNGELDLVAESMGTDEIGKINDNFYYMLDSLKSLIKTREELSRRIKETELIAAKAKIKALQSQIDPHFLYNTLDLILWKALYMDIPKVESLVQSLADFYKLSLGKGNDIVTVSQEIEHIRNYLTIQNMRYEDRISFSVDTDGVADCLLPKITLQPLVENSVLHGILECDRKKGSITIKGRKHEGLLLMDVIDTGGGMDQTVVDRLNAFDTEGAGIGVRNVNERLKLYFGQEYGLRYESRPELGTKVTIRIPAITDRSYFSDTPEIDLEREASESI